MQRQVIILTGAAVVLLAACASERGEMDRQIVFRDSAGRELRLDDIQGTTGLVQFEILGSANIPEQAERLHQAGRRAGAEGDYVNALALFAQSAAVAPDWPYPLYDAAFTYLLMGDFAAALDYYRQTVALAPRGFFTALTAVDALEREEADMLPVGTFFAYTQLERIQDRDVKEARVRGLLASAPAFAPALKDLALLLDDDQARQNALEQGLAADPDPETRGILLINRAIMLFNQGARDEAIAILGSLALDPASSTGSAEQAKAALALLLQQTGP